MSSSEQNAVLKTIADVCHERVHLSLFPLWLHFFVKNLFLGNKKIVKLHHMQQCGSDNNLGLKIRKLSLTFSHIFMTTQPLMICLLLACFGLKNILQKTPSSEVLSHKNEIYVKMLPICKSMLKVDFPSAFFVPRVKTFQA